MFHKTSGQFSAAIMLFAILAQPLTTHASEPISPIVDTQITASDLQLTTKAYSAQQKYFDGLRQETRSKISETKRWVKAQKPPQKYTELVTDLGHATDRLQTRVSPAGRSLKASLKEKVPGLGLVRFGERNFSTFGLLLMLSFGLVLGLMALSNPMSRLGGRH